MRTSEWMVIAFILALMFFACVSMAHAEPVQLIASYYSVDSLKAEGTWRYSKGVMANGRLFQDNNFTCASWDFPIGTYLSVRRVDTGKSIKVKVTDRTARRFKGKRIDLSLKAMRRLDGISQGLVPCSVEVIP